MWYIYIRLQVSRPKEDILLILITNDKSRNDDKQRRSPWWMDSGACGQHSHHSELKLVGYGTRFAFGLLQAGVTAKSAGLCLCMETGAFHLKQCTELTGRSSRYTRTKPNATPRRKYWFKKLKKWSEVLGLRCGKHLPSLQGVKGRVSVFEWYGDDQVVCGIWKDNCYR